ncbi:hypothetical protein ACT7DZ_14665 [Bacillus cereus]
MDYIKKYFQRLLPTSIQINSPLVDEINPAYSLLTRKEKIVIAQKLQKKKIPISRIAKELAMDIRTLQKYIHLPKHQLSTLFMTKFERERFENIQRKKQIIKQVKKLHSEGMSIRKIAVYVHLDRRTVRRYIKENLRTISVQTRSGRTTKINSYLEHMITYMQKRILLKENS